MPQMFGILHENFPLEAPKVLLYTKDNFEKSAIDRIIESESLSRAYLALARLSCIFDKHFTYRSHHFLSPMLLSTVNSAVSNSYLDCKTVSTVVASIIHPKLDYCNSVIHSS